MKAWYKLKPVDTFFFKGATPMLMGENHTSENVFPPSAETIEGAVRTATLHQQDIDFNEYGQKYFNDDKIISAIGKAGEKPPFEIIGPLFSKKNLIYFPAPFHWYAEKNDLKMNKLSIPVYKSKVVKSSFVSTSKGRQLYIAIGRSGELKTIGGMWIAMEDLYSTSDKINLKTIDEFVVSEPRTGIALERNRKVRESHLYTFSHIRFQPDVELVFGIRSEEEPLLRPEGILQLGGEKRLGYYEKIKLNIPEQEENGNAFMSLSALPCSGIDPDVVIATGKILYRGGWDMKKVFHKPLIGFFPAGSVFSKKINKNQISVKGD